MTLEQEEVTGRVVLERTLGAGERLDVILLPPCPAWILRLKTVPEHAWQPDRRCWTVPDTPEAVAQLHRLFGPSVVEREPGIPAPRIFVSRGAPGSLVVRFARFGHDDLARMHALGCRRW